MTRGFVKLDYGDSGNTLMPAVIFGIWAVHRCPEHRPLDMPAHGWRITHAPSGMCLSAVSDALAFNDAQRIARLLSERLPKVSAASRPRDARYIVEATFAEVLGR